MFGKVITLSVLGAAIILLLILQSTTPASAGPVGILAVFFLYYVIFLGLMTWALRLGSIALARIARPVTVKKPLQALSFKRSYYLSSIIALGPVMLLGMGSVGKLGFYEVTLVVIFVLIGVFYILKRAD